MKRLTGWIAAHEDLAYFACGIILGWVAGVQSNG